MLDCPKGHGPAPLGLPGGALRPAVLGRLSRVFEQGQAPSMTRGPVVADLDQDAAKAQGGKADGARRQNDGPAASDLKATEALGQQAFDPAVAHLPPAAVMGLQRQAGNAAVAAWLASRPRPAAANARAPAKEALAAAVPPETAAVSGGEASDAETAIEPAVPVSGPEKAAPGSPAPPADGAPPPASPIDVPDSAVPETQAVIQQVAAAHDAATLQVNSTSEAAAASLDQVVTDSSASLDAAQGTQTQAITGVFARARQQIDQDASSQISKLHDFSSAQQKHLDEWLARAGAKCEADLTAKCDRTTSLGRQFLEATNTAGAQAAQNLTTQGVTLASRARGIGQLKGAAAKGDSAELRQSQAKAAHDLAEETAGKISTGATQLAPQIQAQGGQVGQSFVDQAGQIARQASAQLGPMLQQLTAIHTSASTTLAQGIGTATETIERVRKEGHAKLATGERQALTNLRTQVAAKKKELATLGREAQTQLRQGAQSALQTGSQTVQAAIAQLGGVTIRPEEGAELAASAGQLKAAFTDLGVTVTGAAAGARSALSKAGTEAVASLSTAAETVHKSLAPSLQAAGGHIAQVGASHESQLARAVSQAIASGDSNLSQAMTALDTQLSQVEPSFTVVLTGIQGKLNEQSTAALTKMQEPVNTLPSRIEEAQKKLDDDAHTSWLGRQWADIKEMVTSPGFWVGLGVGLLVGAIIILSAGTATPFIIMAAAVAGGAAAGFAGTVANNLSQGARGADIFKGALKNMLIGAAAGAVAAGILLFAGVGLPAGAGLIGGLGLTGASAVAAGFIALEVSAVAANTISNLLSGERWDKGLLAALLLAPLIAKVAKWAGAKFLGEQPEGQGGRDQGGRGQGLGEDEGQGRGQGQGEGAGARPYDPATRTPAQLAEDVDPAPRVGETPEQAQARAEAAQHEIALRRAMGTYEALGERPPRINIAANDAEFAAEGAHTLERHGPDIPLERGDAPPGGRTIEGRIYGDPPWPGQETWSYKWLDPATMNRTINDLITANWEQIRSDLAFHGEYEGRFDAGHAVGDGFFNERQALPGGGAAPVARYGVTSYVVLRLTLLAGEPVRFFVETAYPSGLP